MTHRAARPLGRLFLLTLLLSSTLSIFSPPARSDGEVEELAQACVAMLEVKGQAVERTLSEMSAEAGGFLLPGDAPRVRARAEALLHHSR